MIKDTTALGAASGFVAAFPQLIFDFIAVQLGYSNYYAFQISGSIYLFPKLTTYFFGFLLGGVIWFSMGMLLGVICAFYIKFTGTDFWWLKGLFISNLLMFVMLYGFFYTLGGARIVPFDISTNWTILLGNIIFGLTVSYLIVRWGERPILNPNK